VIVVADSGPLLHLHWVDSLTWALPPLPIHVVEEVWQEVQELDPGALKDPRLLRATASKEPISLLGPFQLDEGEKAALCFALSQEDRRKVLVLCDERAARAACSALFISVTGSIGLILEAFRAGRVSQDVARCALRELPNRGRLHVDPSLIQKVLESLQPPPA
jgi:predicted nucleic acid-binding protein